MSLILALETATEQSSVALLENDVLLCEVSLSHGRDLSRMLLMAVEDCMQLGQRSLWEVDAIACSVGPGSFTGLRIGVTAAKTLAFAVGKPVIALSTLHILAASIPLSMDGLVIPLIDARRNEFFGAVFSLDNGQRVRHTPDSLVHAAVLPRFVLADSAPSQGPSGGATVTIVAAAPVWERLKETFAGSLPPLFTPAFPQARVVALLGRDALNRGEILQPADLTPAYLRRSYAEEKLGGDAG